MEPRNRIVQVTGCFLGMLLLTGCGSDGPPTGTVSGTVTHNGKPASGATVFFYLKAGGGSATTDAKGNYAAPVPLGEAKVAVNPPIDPDGKTAPPPAYKKYENAEKSGVAITVKSGSNTLDIDIK